MNAAEPERLDDLPIDGPACSLPDPPVVAHRETPVSPAGDTPPDQDSEPPRTADDGTDADEPGTAPPATHPASPGALH